MLSHPALKDFLKSSILLAESSVKKNEKKEERKRNVK